MRSDSVFSGFVVHGGFEAAYRRLLRDGELDERVLTAREMLRACCACPRACAVDRTAGELGECGTSREAIVASAIAHFGEEPCLVGKRGSGTIFFSRCNLHCVFCQNHDLSQRRDGEECTPERIAELALQLQGWGCHNVNFVTPEHVVPQVVEAIAVAAGRGLTVPIVYNTSAYDSLASLQLLDGLVDIYMPDFKFWQPASARRYSDAQDYPQRAREALREMQRQVGPLCCDTDGVALRGVLVRHLVMPQLAAESAAILHWLATELSTDTYVNIMAQYRPCYQVGTRDEAGQIRFPELNRRPTPEELAAATTAAHEAGLWRLEGAA